MTCYSKIIKEIFARHQEHDIPKYIRQNVNIDDYVAEMLDTREKTINAISSVNKDIRNMENEHRKQRDILYNKKREIQKKCPHLNVVIYSDMNETTRVCEDCGAEL